MKVHGIQCIFHIVIIIIIITYHLFSFYEELSTLGAVIFEVFRVIFHPKTLTWRTGVFCESFLCSLTHRLWLFLGSWHKPFSTLLLNIMHYQDLWLNNVIQVVHTLNFVSVGVCSSCAHMFSPLSSTFFCNLPFGNTEFCSCQTKRGLPVKGMLCAKMFAQLWLLWNISRLYTCCGSVLSLTEI